MQTPYKKKVKQYDDNITKKKQKLAKIQGNIIGSTTKKSTTSEINVDSSKQQVQEFINNLNQLKDTLEERGRFIQLQYQKETMLYQNDREQLRKRIFDLEKKVEDKDAKIQKQIEIIAQHKHQLKAIKEVSQAKQKRLKQVEIQLKQCKQENTKTQLQIKSLKTDNQFLSRMCEKMMKNKEQQGSKQVEEKQKRILSTLFTKNLIQSKLQRQVQARYHHHDLSNKIKLDQAIHKYQELKRASVLKIQRLQQDIDEKDRQIQLLEKQNRELRMTKKQIQELRASQKLLISEKQKAMQKMEFKLQQSYNMNELLREELKDKSYIPIVKEKIGSIIKIKRNLIQ